MMISMNIIKFLEAHVACTCSTIFPYGPDYLAGRFFSPWRCSRDYHSGCCFARFKVETEKDLSFNEKHC